MILADLKIHQLRSIKSAQIKLNPRFNCIIGPNGSGKTSILEALYLLSCGHSFRSREISPIVSHDSNSLTIFARSTEQDTISIQKSAQEATQLKLNNLMCSATSQLAYALPCQIIYADLFDIIDAGPSVRRSLLDWGLFHVKHNYLSVWKEYKKVLKQRNALLKQNAPYAHFIPWDKQLSTLAEILDRLRKDYFFNWAEELKQILPQLSDIQCTLEYFKGWDRKGSGKSLEELLAENFVSDKQKLYTQNGPHQADVIIESKDLKAKRVLSRGQQKILLIALKLAQGNMLDKDCLYLFDDFSAELDAEHQSRLLNYLSQSRGQYVITSLQAIKFSPYFNDSEVDCFDIACGQITVKIR